MATWDDDDDSPRSKNTGVKARKSEWDCPSCNANNPAGDGIGHNDEIRCNYCGEEFKVTVNVEGVFKFKVL